MLSFLLSLGLSFGAVDFDSLPVSQVETIAQEVMSSMRTEMRTQPSLMVTERPEPTPLGALNFVNGKCVVIINTNKHAWSQWGRFLNKDNRADWNNIIAASVAHEIGHCLREAREFAKNSLPLNPELNGIRNTGTPRLTAEDIVYKQELFADTVAVLYAREHAGAQAGEVIRTLISAREHHGRSEPTHNTAESLNKLVDLDTTRQQNETLGGAAIRLLTSH